MDVDVKGSRQEPTKERNECISEGAVHARSRAGKLLYLTRVLAARLSRDVLFLTI